MKSPAEIIAALEEYAVSKDAAMKRWAKDTLETIRKRSPTSVYVTLRQMQLGRRWSISETFRREFAIAEKFMAHPDFTEGVSALLIRKDGNPQWQPKSLDDVSPKDRIEEPFFETEAERPEKGLRAILG